MIFFGKILLKTLYFFITNISELDFEEKKSAEIVLHPMHGGGGLKAVYKIYKKKRKIFPRIASLRDLHPSQGYI